MKTFYTVGEIAILCDVAPRTVQKWFDKGLIKGYLVPGTKFRRAKSEAVRAFLISNNLPLPTDLNGPPKREGLDVRKVFSDRDIRNWSFYVHNFMGDSNIVFRWYSQDIEFKHGSSFRLLDYQRILEELAIILDKGIDSWKRA